MINKEVLKNYTQLPNSSKIKLFKALDNVTYEVFPSRYLDTNLSFLPPNTKISVTCSPRYGIEGTLVLADKISEQGLLPIPHLPARMIHSKAEIAKIGQRLSDKGLHTVFIVGGNNEIPNGNYAQALDLLEELYRLGYRFRKVGVGGYPDGHPQISDAKLDSSLMGKHDFLRSHNTPMYIVSQLCFNATRLIYWCNKLDALGIDVPISISTPGAISITRVLRFGTEYGVTIPRKYIKNNFNMMNTLLGFSPERIVLDLFRNLKDEPKIDNVYFSTFNQLKQTYEFVEELKQVLT